jgi:hypothetical protein
MKKIIILASSLSMLFLMACGSTESAVKETPMPVVKADNSIWVTASNKQLEKIPVTGFEYKDAAMPSWKYDAWAKTAAPAVKKIIQEMPEGHVFQVTGHTDARGPEEPRGNKPGNIKISTERAKTVYDALRKNGITSEKMTYKGVGSSQLLPGEDPRSPRQRRVTFLVIPE